MKGWLSRLAGRQGAKDPASGPFWSEQEVEALAKAVRNAPSVHNTQPWSLRVLGSTATLHERPDLDLSWHDPQGRDRTISCGAALANLVLAVRNTGWAVDERLEPSEEEPDVVACVLATRREAPTAVESQRYRAIIRRTSHRRAFERRGLSDATYEALRSPATSPDVYARWVTGEQEAFELARLLGYAARARRGDEHYQRELALWTQRTADAEPPEGLPSDAHAFGGVPAVGLVTSSGALPDEHVLASRIEDEAVLVLSTRDDSRSARLRLGEAMQLAWLEATSLGLATSVMTHPFQLSEVRRVLAERLGLPGTPWVVMRFGYPTVPPPRSSRRPLSDTFHAEGGAADSDDEAFDTEEDAFHAENRADQ